MVRIHEAWHLTKTELAETKAELKRVQSIAAPHQRDAAMQQMQALTVELQDKSRFNELQLTGAREECTKLSSEVEELRARLTHATAHISELQTVKGA